MANTQVLSQLYGRSGEDTEHPDSGIGIAWVSKLSQELLQTSGGLRIQQIKNTGFKKTIYTR